MNRHEPPGVLFKLFLLCLLLTFQASAEVLFWKPQSPGRGRVWLVHPEGKPWAEKLHSLGFHCAWSPAPSAQNLKEVCSQLGTAVVVSGGTTSASVLQLCYGEPRLLGCALVDPPSELPWMGLPPCPVLLVGSSLPSGPGQVGWFLRPRLETVVQEGGLAALLSDNHPVQKTLRQFLVAHTGPEPLGLAGVPFVASPNWSVRSVGERIDTVVVHATVINTMEGTQRAFLDDRVRRVSAHYVVDRDGTIVQMVDERLAAWHAGVSELEGRSGVNDFSVGVELINLNDGKDPYPEAQVRALARIIVDLRSRWKIPRSRIVSHAHIARPVGRKSDPLGFDFDHLFRLLGD